MTEEKAKELAEEHWEWLEPILLPHYSPVAIATMKYLYITAMVHGIKHGQEASNDR